MRILCSVLLGIVWILLGVFVIEPYIDNKCIIMCIGAIFGAIIVFIVCFEEIFG